jgi:hypothetical protein
MRRKRATTTHAQLVPITNTTIHALTRSRMTISSLFSSLRNRISCFVGMSLRVGRGRRVRRVSQRESQEGQPERERESRESESQRGR